MDVYCEWLDACNAARDGGAGAAAGAGEGGEPL
ncbi:hypothetical protein EON68_01935 [archaeon]|nr:MAG: hypothetical protein EON68_01935 [archaeon]